MNSSTVTRGVHKVNDRLVLEDIEKVSSLSTLAKWPQNDRRMIKNWSTM